MFELDPQEIAFPVSIKGNEPNDKSSRVHAAVELPESAIPSQGLTPLTAVGADSRLSSSGDTAPDASSLASPSSMRNTDDDVLDEAFN